MRDGIEPELVDAQERTALRIACALTRAGALNGQDYVNAVHTLGERGLFEITTLVGYYATLALQLRVFTDEHQGGSTGSRQPPTGD